MAQSLSHKFGQIIGDLLEAGLEPQLRQFAKKHKLYLDKKGKREARSGQLVSWMDDQDNKHDLDFVLERGGTDKKLGVPVAFIESAWRRYTKHSRNKAQEIQGAILPLAFKYKNVSPFIGVVLAGEFTKGAINQLESIGFNILYFPYETVIKAFKKYGIDAAFGEDTPEAEFDKKLAAWANLPNKTDIAKELMRLNKAEVDAFFDKFAKNISRFVERIIILPLHGEESATSSVSDALAFLKQYQEGNAQKPFTRYEITIKYNTGDKIEASFKEKADAIQFLASYG
jgi:hypothetical protein